jgi:hypothetical protein
MSRLYKIPDNVDKQFRHYVMAIYGDNFQKGAFQAELVRFILQGIGSSTAAIPKIPEQHTHILGKRKTITPTEIAGRFNNWILENCSDYEVQIGISQGTLDRAIMSMGANEGTQRKNRRALYNQGCIIKNKRSGKFELPKLMTEEEAPKPITKITEDEQKRMDIMLHPEIVEGMR